MITEKNTFEYVAQIAAIHKLRVNVKSLAAEARIIRKEEKRCGLQYRGELEFHRRGVLRSEARYAQLALAYVRGKKYEQVEGKFSSSRRNPIDVVRLGKKISGFGCRVGSLTGWIQGAE